jgi:RHS repeat-associated protein
MKSNSNVRSALTRFLVLAAFIACDTLAQAQYVDVTFFAKVLGATGHYDTNCRVTVSLGGVRSVGNVLIHTNAVPDGMEYFFTSIATVRLLEDSTNVCRFDCLEGWTADPTVVHFMTSDPCIDICYVDLFNCTSPHQVDGMSGGQWESFDVIVSRNKAQVQFSPPCSVPLPADGQTTVTASLENSHLQAPITWSLSPGLDCKIDSTNGVVTAGYQIGTITVIASDINGCTARKKLDVVDPNGRGAGGGGSGGGGGTGGGGGGPGGCRTCRQNLYVPGSNPNIDVRYGLPKRLIGQGFITLNSVDVRMDLGNSSDGGDAGGLRIHEEAPSGNLYSPGGLQYPWLRTDVQIINSNGYIRQVWAPDGLADVVITTNNISYEVRIYRPSDVGSFGTNLYAINGGASPFAKWVIQNPESTSSNKLRVTEYPYNQSTRVYDYQWLTNGWQLTTAGGLKVESLTKDWTTNGTPFRTETYQLKEWSTNLAFSETKRYQLTNGNQNLIEQVVGAGAAARTNSWLYYSNGLVQQTSRPDGSWQIFSYDDKSRVVTQFSAFLNSGPTTDPSLCRSIEYNYSSGVVSGSGDDSSLSPASPRRTIEFILGTPVSMNYSVFKPGESRQITCLSPSAAWDNSSNLVTITRYYTNGWNFDKLQSVLRPDGTMTLYQHLQADYSGGAYTNLQNTTNIVISGQPDGGLTSIVDGTTNITILTPLGQTVSTKSIDIASGIVISSQTYSDSDSYGRPQKVTFLDGSYDYTVYTCCGGGINTNREGTVTTSQYDDLQRLVATTTDGITRSNILDVAGRVTATLRIGTNGNVITNAVFSYDSAGVLFSSADALGYPTSFSESGTPPTKTTTYPNSGTKVDTFARDGTLLKTSGTAVHGVRYTNGLTTDGGVSRFYTAEIRLGTGGTDTEEAVTNLMDFAGRNYKTVYGDGAYSQSFYNASGQLWKTVDPDDVRTLYGYNGKGEKDTAIIDMEKGNSFSPSTTNRIQKTITQYATAHGVDVRQTSTYQWFTNGSPTSNLVGVSETAVSGLQTWNTRFGLTNSLQKVLGGGGAATVYSTNADRSFSVSTLLNGRTLSVTRYDSSGNQLGGTTFSYDQHARAIMITDARNGSSTNAYDNLDRVTVAATPSSDGIAPRQVTSTSYDNMGRTTSVTLPDGGIVQSTYHLTGELATNSGARTYPVAYSYDFAGRMKTMKTWKNFSAGSGAAVTTWNYDSKRGSLVGKVYDDGKGPNYTNTSAGRLKTRAWARGVWTTNGYNNAGDLTSISYSDSTPWVSYGLDRAGRRTNVSYSNTTETLVYDIAGNLLTNSYSGGPLNGLNLVNVYDSLNRRIIYGVLTNGIFMTKTTNGYDNASRLLVVSDTIVVVNYSYLTNSSLVNSIDFKQGGATRLTTTKTYDLVNRLTNIVNTPGAVGESPISFACTVNSANQRTRAVLADGSYWLYTYDALGQVTSGKHYWSDGTPIAGQQFEYAFDEVGNRAFAGQGGDEYGRNLRYENYTANNLNQYTQRTVPGYQNVLGAANSNTIVTVNNQPTYRKGEYYRAELTLGNAAAPVYPSITNLAVLANGTNADITSTNTGSLFLPKTPEVFTYDADGNLTSDGRWTNRWDAENRLIEMESLTGGPANSLRRLGYAYDCRGRRLSKLTESWTNAGYSVGLAKLFIFDGWNLNAELNATNNTLINSYLWGNDVSGSVTNAAGIGGLLAGNFSTGGVQAVAYDANGSAMALVSASNGVSSARYAYGPFGEPIESSEGEQVTRLNPYRFSTRYYEDDARICDFTYRSYSSSSGRWLSRDPLGDVAFLMAHSKRSTREDLETMRSASLEPAYEFVRNSPVNAVDPLGLRRLGFAGQIYVWEDTCGKCPELLKNYKYIDEDFPGLYPLHLGSHDADAIYIPVGEAWKIGDTAVVHVNCDCCTHCVTISQILPPITAWRLPQTVPPRNWPGSDPPYFVPGGMECAEMRNLKVF